MSVEDKVEAAARGAFIARGYGVARGDEAARGRVLLPARLPEWRVPPESEAPAAPAALDWAACAEGPVRADRLLDALLQAARREQASHLHLHYWLSEVLRARLDAWLAAGRADWRDLRRLAQDAVSAGINLRTRPVDDAVETAGAFFREPRFGPPGPEGAAHPRRVLASLIFALSFGGPGLDRALVVLAAGPGALPVILGRFGQLAGAFFGDRLEDAGAALAAVRIDPSFGPELARASLWPPTE